VFWDSLLADDWPAEWSPLTVVVRPLDDTIELVVEGRLDAWTVGALLRTLDVVHEPCFTEVHVDLHGVTSTDGMAQAGLARCRELAAQRGATFRVTAPPILREPTPFEGPAAALPFAAS